MSDFDISNYSSVFQKKEKKRRNFFDENLEQVFLLRQRMTSWNAKESLRRRSL